MIRGETSGSGTTFAAAGVGATGATVSAGLANATLAGVMAGGVSSGVGAAAQGRDWETRALHGAITSGLVGNLSDGTYYGNPAKGVETFRTSLSTGNFAGLGEQALYVATTQAAGQVEARLAREMGLAPDQLNWLLMGTSILGDSLPFVGSRYNPNADTVLSPQVVGVLNRKNPLLGATFDVADIMLGYQGLPDATVRDVIENRSPDQGVNTSMPSSLTCHSLGTITCTYVGRNIGGVDLNLAALPLGIVAPVSMNGTTTNVIGGYGDAINGFYLGKLFNWDAGYVYVPFIVGHPYINYVKKLGKNENGGEK